MRGIGSILHQLGGGSEQDPAKYYGRLITDANIDDNELTMKFDDGVQIRVLDDAQSCCENRYMTCDDDPKSLIGGKLVSIMVRDGEPKSDEYGQEHEVCFLQIQTDNGFITVATHNEHNGYYGGFGLSIRETPK